jgi:hypothetical protein
MNTDTTHDNPEPQIIEISLEEAVFDLSDNATVADLLELFNQAGVDPAEFSLGAVSLLSRNGTPAVKAKIEAETLASVKANNGSGLDKIADATRWPKELVSSALVRGIATEKNPEGPYTRVGKQRGALYYLAGTEPSIADVEATIVDLFENSDERLSKTHVVDKVSCDTLPSHLVRSVFDGLVKGDGAPLVAHGNGCARRYGLADRTYTEPEPAPKKAPKKANVAAPVIRRIRPRS